MYQWRADEIRHTFFHVWGCPLADIQRECMERYVNSNNQKILLACFWQLHLLVVKPNSVLCIAGKSLGFWKYYDNFLGETPGGGALRHGLCTSRRVALKFHLTFMASYTCILIRSKLYDSNFFLLRKGSWSQLPVFTEEGFNEVHHKIQSTISPCEPFKL